MKNDALYDYVKSQLEKGVSADDLFDVMSMAEDDFNAEKEKKEKEEAQKKVKEELKKRSSRKRSSGRRYSQLRLLRIYRRRAVRGRNS